MRIVRTPVRYNRAAQQFLILERFKSRVITLPNRQSTRRNGIGFLHLRPQESGDDLAWQIGGSDIDPSVLFHLSAKELAAIRALLTDDLGALDQRRVVDQ